MVDTDQSSECKLYFSILNYDGIKGSIEAFWSNTNTKFPAFPSVWLIIFPTIYLITWDTISCFTSTRGITPGNKIDTKLLEEACPRNVVVTQGCRILNLRTDMLQNTPKTAPQAKLLYQKHLYRAGMHLRLWVIIAMISRMMLDSSINELGQEVEGSESLSQSLKCMSKLYM